MEPRLEITETALTPEVFFDLETCTLRMSGVSRPENTVEFFRDLELWLDEFLTQMEEAPQNSKEVKFELSMDYYNSISSKFIAKLLRTCSQRLEGHQVFRVLWFYAPDDYESLEYAEDFAALVGCPFETIERAD